MVEEEAQRTYAELVPGFNQTLMLPEELIGLQGREIRQATMSGLDNLLYNATAARMNGLETSSTGFPAVQSLYQNRNAPSATPFMGLHLAATAYSQTPASAPSVMMGSNNSLFSNPSPYKDEHQEICLLGKGGYGQVWKVRNHLDNQLYAIKKIVITSRRLQKFSENAQVEALLAELRTLAKLHHTNIVRYYHGWVEKTDSASNTTMITREQRNLLEAPSITTSSSAFSTNDDITSGMQSLTVQKSGFLDDSKERSGPAILFEQSDLSGDVVFADDSLSRSVSISTEERRRRGSRATNSSSTPFNKASLLSVDEEADDDVETIPRSLPRANNGRLSIPNQHDDGAVVEEHLNQIYTGPDITLFIKMSLHPTTLSSYLSPDPPSEQEVIKLRHCFHQKPAVEMLMAILDGVEYLHSQRIVHRDLKPANIFLSVNHNRPPATSGFVDVTACKQCGNESARDHIYLTPCIGDFGLIAEISEDKVTDHAPQSPGPHGDTLSSSLPSSFFEPSPLAKIHNDVRPVGTQFYRPNKMPLKEPRICPKLDVYSLGIIAAELCCKFDTRTERAITLTDLGNGKLSKALEDSQMADGILSMVKEDRDERWDCAMVREWLQYLQAKEL